MDAFDALGVAVAAAVGLASLAGGCAAKRGDDRLDPLGLVPPPPTISAAQAADHVGELVVVRTRIGAAEVRQGQAILQPEGVPAGGFDIAIAPPMVGPSVQELVEKYRGREVRAVGYVSQLGGDLEMLIGDPSRIRLADQASDVAAGPEAASEAPPPPAKPVAPAPPPAARAPAKATAAARVPGAATVDEGHAAARASGATTTDEACAAAREAWRKAARAARAPLQAVLRCLSAQSPHCSAAAARARVALAEVAASEERLRWVCGGAS